MFNFFKKKTIPVETEETNIVPIEGETVEEAALDIVKPTFIEKISPSQISEYFYNGQLVEIKNTVAAGLSKVIEHLPEMSARKGMDELYRLDMHGIKGVLMSHRSGNTTTIIDETTKKIKATATISQVGTTAPQVLANIMNVASVATGMYYMSAITNQLQHTERILGGVKQFLEDEKKAEIKAIFGELRKIYSDYQFCLTDDGFNNDLLANNRKMLSDIEQKLDKNIEFYLLQLNHNYDKFKEKDKTKVVNETMVDFCDHIILLKQLYDLYCVKTVLEINYADKGVTSNDAFIESRKSLLLSYHSRINDELEKMADVKEYFANERFSLLEYLKTFEFDEAYKDALMSTKDKFFLGVFQAPVIAIQNAQKNYKENRKTDAENKTAEVENNIGGFNIEPPTQYTEMIDNLVMLSNGCPDLILSNDKVYMLIDGGTKNE